MPTRPQPKDLTDQTQKWIPHGPTTKQAEFLRLTNREALYGGAAGGGKSDALLMAALQHVDTPGYAAILFRRTYADLALPGALLDRARDWLDDTPAKWLATEKTWRFPSGATLTFGYLDHPNHKFRYQSSEFQFIGFDELTQFGEAEYRYLFSRLRRRSGVKIPLRMRAASNPGGIGHQWVKNRFLVDGDPQKRRARAFVPAKLADNPYVDQESYEATLQELDPVTRQQLLQGNWEVGDDGLLNYDVIVSCQADTLWAPGQRPSHATELYLGVDIGRSRDLSVIWTWEKIGDVCWCREIHVMDQVPFQQQKDEIKKRISRSVCRCVIDKGGIGMQLAEDLEREYRGIVEGVQLTSGVQGRLAQKIATAFHERKVRVPDNPILRDDLQLVRKLQVSAGGITRVATDRSEIGHADRFWAAALGLEPALQPRIGTRRPISSPARRQHGQTPRR